MCTLQENVFFDTYLPKQKSVSEPNLKLQADRINTTGVIRGNLTHCSRLHFNRMHSEHGLTQKGNPQTSADGLELDTVWGESELRVSRYISAFTITAIFL